MNKMADKETIYTTPDPKSQYADTPNACAQDYDSTDSNLPYSLRNCKFATYSTNTMKNLKNKENEIDDKVKIDTPPLTPMYPVLIPPMLTTNMMAPPTTISHIH